MGLALCLSLFYSVSSDKYLLRSELEGGESVWVGRSGGKKESGNKVWDKHDWGSPIIASCILLSDVLVLSVTHSCPLPPREFLRECWSSLLSMCLINHAVPTASWCSLSLSLSVFPPRRIQRMFILHMHICLLTIYFICKKKRGYLCT